MHLTERRLTRKQERFVQEYLVDLSPADAYVRAGYEVASREVAWKASNRLLKNVEVVRAISESQSARMDRLEIDGDWVVQRFNFIYLEAIRVGDLKAAGMALQNIAKLLGLFERHQGQKAQYTMKDIDRLKTELRESGFDLDRIGVGMN